LQEQQEQVHADELGEEGTEDTDVPPYGADGLLFG